MGTALAFKLPIGTLFHLALINPLQAFKMFSLISINATLDVLGPAGIYAMQTYRDGLGWLLLGALVAWILLPLGLSFAVFYRRGDV
jgi:Cu-processing system permease protein